MISADPYGRGSGSAECEKTKRKGKRQGYRGEEKTGKRDGKKAKEQLTTKVLVTNKSSVDITRVYGLPYGGGHGGGSGQADFEN
jgi:hypothetical protein